MDQHPFANTDRLEKKVLSGAKLVMHVGPTMYFINVITFFFLIQFDSTQQVYMNNMSYIPYKHICVSTLISMLRCTCSEKCDKLTLNQSSGAVSCEHVCLKREKKPQHITKSLREKAFDEEGKGPRNYTFSNGVKENREKEWDK